MDDVGSQRMMLREIPCPTTERLTFAAIEQHPNKIPYEKKSSPRNLDNVKGFHDLQSVKHVSLEVKSIWSRFDDLYYA